MCSLVTKLGGNEQETRFEDTQRGGDWHGVEILDLDAFNVLIYVLYCHFVEIPFLALKQKEELTLSGVRTQNDRCDKSLRKTRTFILCITAETMMRPRSLSASG